VGEVDAIFHVAEARVAGHSVGLRPTEVDANPVVVTDVVGHGIPRPTNEDANPVVRADVVGHGVGPRKTDVDAIAAIAGAGVVDHGVVI
jgi:hypothetical protein